MQSGPQAVAQKTGHSKARFADPQGQRGFIPAILEWRQASTIGLLEQEMLSAGDNRRFLGNVVFLLVAVSTILLFGAQKPSKNPRPYEFFARRGTNFWQRVYTEERSVRVFSPSRDKVIVAEYDPNPPEWPQMRVHVEAFGKKFSTSIGKQVNCEVLWAPDSKAFFVSYSEGGLVGFYRTEVYYVEENGLRRTEPTNQVEDEASSWMKRFKCDPREDFREPPNLVGISWLGDSTRLLLAAQIATHSVCDSYGTFRAYQIELPEGTVTKQYDQIQAKRKFWNEMGFELRAAQDSCVRNPKSCEIPSNHGR